MRNEPNERFQFPSSFQLRPSLGKLSAARSIAFRVLFKASQASDVGSIPTAPTINRVDSVALALSSADSGPQKAGVLVQSWSKASTKQRERLTPCESAFLFPD